MQAVPPRCATHGDRVKPSSLNEHIRGCGRNHRLPAAHHAGQSEWSGVIGNDQVLRIERALHTIERLEPFAFTGAADNDAAFDLVQIEGVGGLAHGHPDEVGGVYCIRDLLLFQEPEVARNLSG